jgi:hypothetical protein
MLGPYKHAHLNSGYLGYKPEQVVVYIERSHPNSSFTIVDSSSKDAC